MARLRWILVLLACVAYWAALGALLGAVTRHPLGGLLWGLGVGVVYSVLGSWSADKFPRDAWDARLLESASAPHLYKLLRALCDRAGLDLPTLYFIPHPEPNAFAMATGEGTAAIVVTTGLTRRLGKDEVQAVMALMVARLATGAMPAWTLAATLAGIPLQAGLSLRRRPGLGWLGAALFAVSVYPAAALLRLAWSGGVVTASDYHAAHLTAQAGSLGKALLKMEAARPGEAVPDEAFFAGDAAEGGAEAAASAGNPATALLFAVPPRPLPAPLGFLRLPAEGRAARIADVVPVPEPAPEPDEEFRIY